VLFLLPKGGENVAKMGRPTVEIDKQEFERLLAINCSLPECVAWFDLKLGSCSESTLRRWCKKTYDMTFESVKAQKSEVFKIRVRRALNDMLGHNAAVTIFTAKNVLGWTDKMEQTVNDASHMSLDVNLIKSKLKDGDTNAD
jgi:hypothetical protein